MTTAPYTKKAPGEMGSADEAFRALQQADRYQNLARSARETWHRAGPSTKTARNAYERFETYDDAAIAWRESVYAWFVAQVEKERTGITLEDVRAAVNDGDKRIKGADMVYGATRLVFMKAALRRFGLKVKK